MIKMRKRFIVILIISVLWIVNDVNGQGNNLNKIKIGFDASIGAATKNSAFGYSLGISLLAKYKLSNELTAVAGLGYTRLLTKDTSPIPDYDFIPLRAGVKVFPIMESVYIQGNVGAGFGTRNGSTPVFLFGGAAGYEWEQGYDLSIRYEGYQQSRKSTTYQPLNGQISLGLSYWF